MKIVKYLMPLFLFMSSASLGKEKFSLREYVNQSTYMAELGDGSHGTAFQITYKKKKYILSNSHVCDSFDTVVLIDTETSEKFTKRVIRTDRDMDLCLIEGLQDKPGLSLGNPAYKGQPIAIIGHPRGWSTVMTKGEIFDISVEEEVRDDSQILCMGENLRIVPTKDPKDPYVCLRKYEPVMRTTAEVLPGSSGSAVVSLNGHVVGVVFMYYEDNQWSAAIPLSTVKKFLEEK